MTNQTPESVIAEALRYMVPSGDATMKRESQAHNIAAALRAANMLREPDVPNAATEELLRIARRDASRFEDEAVDAIAERDAALAAIERVRAIHRPTLPGYGPKACVHDGRAWPCETMAALDGASEPEEKP